jgi:hypothetical protein
MNDAFTFGAVRACAVHCVYKKPAMLIAAQTAAQTSAQTSFDFSVWLPFSWLLTASFAPIVAKA